MQLIDTFDRGASYGLAAPCLLEPGGRTLSYGDVQVLSYRIANGLQAAGLTSGNTVGVLSSNHLLTFASLLGVVRSNAVLLPVNARNSPEENVNILARGGCEFLFIHTQFADQLPQLREAIPGLRGVVCIDADLADAPSLEHWAASQSAEPFRSHAQTDDVVAIRGTGGTTGLPKGVMVTHRNYLALLASWYAAMPAQERPVHLVVAPLSHAAGSASFAACAYGGCNVIMPSADPGAIIDAIGRYKVTQIYMPPTAIYKLLSHPDVRQGDYSSLRYFLYSSSPMSVNKLREALDIFGPVMVQAFGQAEAPFVCTVMTAAEHAHLLANPALSHRLASCGRPSPFVRLKIMSPEGKLLPPGERGEIVVQGDLVAKGYYQDPVKTAETFKDGWLHTGDIGHLDEDGYLYIVDRMKDIIISGGFNISPSEVEQVLWAHPSISDCAVIGVPDDHWGEAVKAVVEIKPGAEWNAEQVMAYCRERLGGVKAPKTIEVWKQLPRSSVGKVLKRDIREHYWTGRTTRI